MSDVQLGGSLTLAGARKVMDAAMTEAQRRGVRICVAVSGPAGDLLTLARMDGVAPLAAETARRKCWSVAITRKATSEFGIGLKADLALEPELFHGMLKIGDMVAIAGGVPVVSGGILVGAVGVSGATSDEDHSIAALAAAVITD